MPEQTATPIPTQLNIAPRGKSWKDWRLVDGTDGFPTRETMEKYLCNPARVRELEECRALNLETIERQNKLLDASKCQGCAVQQGTHVPAEAVVQIQEPATQSSEILISAVMLKVSTLVDKRASGEPCAEAEADLLQFLRTKLAAVQQAALEPFGYVNTHTGQFFKDVEPCRKNNEGHWRTVYTHPTQQGLTDLRWQIVHDHVSGEYIAGRACFVVQIPPLPGANIMRGSVAEHFTKAVDAIAAQAKQGGV